MTTSSQVAGAPSRPDILGRPRFTRGGHIITLLASTWMIGGVFVDAWAHGQHLTETFFSPWHAMFYSGFFATAAWMLAPVLRGGRSGRKMLASVPAGYELGLVGVLVFGVGGVADMLWHTFLGIEIGIEALLSPPHFVLALGMVLVCTSPFRAAWAASGADDAPPLRAFLPALLSMTLAVSIIGLVFYTLWGFSSANFITPGALDRIVREFVPTPRGLPLVLEVTQQRGITNILVSNLLLLAPILIMLQRWRLPFGSVTVLFTITGMLMAAMTGFFYLSVLLVPLLGGLVADWLLRVLNPSPRRIGALRVFSAAVPVAVWSLYFLATEIQWGVAWPITLWGGVILWAGLSGLGLSLVAIPSSRNR
jgi:hypothetical protein